VFRDDNPAIFTSRLSENLVASKPWNPYGLNRDNVIGVATRFELEGPGIEFRLGREFPHISRAVLGPTSTLYNGYRVSFLG